MQSNRNAIPGMIEPIEQELLLDLAEFVVLADDEVVCEFGAYFGLSTRCLVDGLASNKTLQVESRRTSALHAYDIFSCSQAGAFARYVQRDAAKAGLTDLLRTNGGRIDFSAVFDHHMKGLPPMLLTRHQTEITTARHVGGSIALMHVDAPKWYAEYMQIMREFGPHLKLGAKVVFQDYFFHWSAGVVGAVQLFIENGTFEPLESAASSLLVRVEKPVTGASLDALDASFQRERTDVLVERAISRMSDFELDRREAFLPRLYLAALQHCAESGDHASAAGWWRRMLKAFGGRVSAPIAGDLEDLLRYGFSARRLYELDITNSA